MKKVIGYLISVIGLVIMVLGLGVFGEVDLYGVPEIYVSGAGIVLVVVGVLIAMRSGEGKKKINGGEDEIPIYEGVGKKRRIVGYRKD